MTPAAVPDRRLLRIAGALLAGALVVAVLVLAGPREAWRTAAEISPLYLLAAAGAALVTTCLRGLRLTLLLAPRRLPLLPGILIAGAAQAAALFVPARVGELALPWLLTRAAACDRPTGLAVLLGARCFDLAGLGVWALASIALVWGGDHPAALLAAALLLLPVLLLRPLVAALTTVVRRLHHPGGTRSARLLTWLEQAHGAIARLRGQPARSAAAAATTLAMWGWVWLMTWLLLAAMGHRWPASTVVAGSAAASVANLLPLNLVANLGTLEAGWTAAFSALGIPLETAAATGIAAHLWALVFAAAIGLLGWLGLSLRWRLEPPAHGAPPGATPADASWDDATSSTRPQP